MVNDIKKVKLDKYISFTDYLAKYLIKYPQVVSVYQMGGWTQPGISDIDIIIVVKQPNQAEFKELNVLNKVLARNAEEEYMLMHAPFVISEEGFKNLDLFFYCSDLKRLQGKEIKINKNSIDLQEIAELYKLVSVLTHTYPRFFSFEKKKSLRSFLTFAYSLKHTYRIIREFDNSFVNIEIEDYIEKMTSLRKRVIENNELDEREVRSLIKLGIRVSVIMLKKVDKIIKARVSFKSTDTSFIYIKNYENIFSFVKNSNSFQIKRKDGINFFELPHSFAIFILMPLDGGILNKFQMKNILGSNSIIVNKKQKALLNQIEKPFSEYSLVFNNCMVYNGMSFELNTPSLWNSRKYRSFNLLDYARKIKYLVMNKKNQMKVAQLINKYNS